MRALDEMCWDTPVKSHGERIMKRCHELEDDLEEIFSDLWDIPNQTEMVVEVLKVKDALAGLYNLAMKRAGH